MIHPFPPVFDRHSEILILGSFPSVKSRESGFYYGHPRNRFWTVLPSLYGETAPRTVEEKKAFLLRRRIALWDVLRSCEIAGSSDAHIKNAEPNDLRVILDAADIKTVCCNGKAALRFYNLFQLPLIGTPAVYLPSTSPANAAWTEDRLSDEWRRLLL